MTAGTEQRTRHEVVVAAPAGTVYDLVARVADWPRVFGPTVHVEQLEQAPGGAGTERLRIWATANDEVRSWTSRRELDPAGRRIEFRQEVSRAPVAAMGGEWLVEPVGDGTTRVVLLHDFRAVGDDPAGIDWITRATDRNSTAELAALRTVAELDPPFAALGLDFTDEVEVAGDPADVYDFLARAEYWPDRLPHVARLELREEDGGVQHLEMDTRAPDGSVHTTTSIRLLLPDGRIVYKQRRMPALLSAHVGVWTVRATAAGCTVSSRHAVTLRPDTVAGVLGEQATLADSGAYVRRALSANSTATMNQARAYAEGRHG